MSPNPILWDVEAFDLQLEEDAECLLGSLQEGDGEHSEALDIGLIKASFRSLLKWATQDLREQLEVAKASCEEWRAGSERLVERMTATDQQLAQTTQERDEARACVNDWRGWAQFVWLDGGLPQGTDDELRRRACERHDLRCTPMKSAG